MIDLSALTAPQLLSVFNALSGQGVKRFTDRKTGVKRLAAFVEQAGISDEALQAAIYAATGAQPTPTEENAPALVEGTNQGEGEPAGKVEGDLPAEPAAEELNETDNRILAMLKEIGPCKVGPMRERWKAEDPTFKRLAPTQQKGIMRRSVRKLEAAGLVRKEGPIFSLPA